MVTNMHSLNLHSVVSKRSRVSTLLMAKVLDLIGLAWDVKWAGNVRKKTRSNGDRLSS